MVLVIAVIGVNARLVVGGKTWADIRYHTEIAPPRLAAADAVQQGTLPAWWDGTGLGVPLAAEPSHGALYPPTWVAATPRTLDLLAIAHLVWAALGVAVWARRRTAHGASEPAALVAGMLVATSGLFASAAIRGALPALAHLPWLGVAAAVLGEAQERRDRVRATIAIGVLLGLVGLSGVLAGLVDALVLVIALAARRRTMGYLGAGLAISAAQWLPAAMQLGAGTGRTITGLPFARLLELVVPGSFGGSDAEHAIGSIAGDMAWAPSLFVGAPLLALAAVRTPPRRVLGVIIAFALLALIVGRGGWPSWLGAPELHLAALVVVLGGAQAGSGLDALIAGNRRATIALAVGGACAGVALGSLGAFRARHPEVAPAIDRALLDGALGLVCLAAAALLAWRGPRRAMPVVFALLVLPTVGSTPSIAPVEDRAIVSEAPAWALATTKGTPPLRVYRPVYMVDTAATVRPPESLVGTPRSALPEPEPETLDDAVATFAGASGWQWGIAAARSEDPARPAVHDRVWLAAARGGFALLDRFGISLAILPVSTLAALHLKPLGQRGRWALVSLPVAPAAAVMRGWMWAVAPEDALALLFPLDNSFGRGTTVLRGGGTSHVDRGPPLPCAIARWSAGDIALGCTSDVDAYAVVSSSAAPGWSASVDEVDAPWLVADVLRRAVAIPSGTHRIEWRYATPGGDTGMMLAGLGIALLIALGLAGLRVRR
jgi:hypothetical protein